MDGRDKPGHDVERVSIITKIGINLLWPQFFVFNSNVRSDRRDRRFSAIVAFPPGRRSSSTEAQRNILAARVTFPLARSLLRAEIGTSTSCTQVIGDTITFVGNSTLAINCGSNTKIRRFGPTKNQAAIITPPVSARPSFCLAAA